MMDISIWCIAAIIPVTSWFIWVIWFMRAWTCIMALWLLATLSGILPLVTACRNWSGDIAIRLCKSAGVAALDALDEALLPLAGLLVSFGLGLLVSSASSADALDVEVGLVDAAAGMLEVSAGADAEAGEVALAPGAVDPVLVVDAVPALAATTSGVGILSAWVLTIGRWPGR